MEDNMETVETQDKVTSPNTNDGNKTTNTPVVETKNPGVDNPNTETKEPYKSFATQEEFDAHASGILNSAKKKAEKELLALLGLKPDEKDKLAKFKEAYDSTLSESEKQAKNIESMTVEIKELKSQIEEKDLIISALSKSSGKTVEDVSKFVKMARGLVDDETTIDQALEQVFAMATSKVETRNVPVSKPLNEPNTSSSTESNPFDPKNGNMTEAGKLMQYDINKARSLYAQAYGKAPNW